MVATQNFRVDGFVTGLAIKAPCKVVTTINLTLSAEQTVNSVACVVGDRVLVMHQTDPIENGIYNVETSAWQRAGDFDGNRDIVRGTLVTVSSAVGADLVYQVATANPITVNTTAITFMLTNPTAELVITTNVISVDESGKTFFLDLAAGFTSTLPAPSIGLKYKFIVKTAPTTAYIIATDSGANLLYGTFLDIVGELTYFSAQDVLNFVASTALVGDELTVESDGVVWYCNAKSGANGGITTGVT